MAQYPVANNNRAPFFDAMTRSAMNGGARLADGRYPTTYQSTSGSLGTSSARPPNMGPRIRNLAAGLGQPTNNAVHSDVDHANTPLAVTTIFDPSATRGQNEFNLGQPLFLLRKKKPSRSSMATNASDVNMTNVVVTAAIVSQLWEEAFVEASTTIREGLTFRGTETGTAGFSSRTRRVAKRVENTDKADDPTWMMTEADVLEKLTPLGLFFTRGVGNGNDSGETPWTPTTAFPDLSYMVYGRMDHVPNVFGACRNELGWVGLIISKKQQLRTDKDIVDQARAPLSFSAWNSPQSKWPFLENNVSALGRVMARLGRVQLTPDAAALGYGPLDFFSDPYESRKSSIDEDYLNRPLAYLDVMVQRDNRRGGIPTWYWQYRTGIFHYFGQVAVTEVRDGELATEELDNALVDDTEFKALSNWARVALEM